MTMVVYRDLTLGSKTKWGLSRSYLILIRSLKGKGTNLKEARMKWAKEMTDDLKLSICRNKFSVANIYKNEQNYQKLNSPVKGNFKSVHTVTIVSPEKERETELKIIRKQLNKLCLVDPDIIDQFIKLLKKNQGNLMIQHHPELDLAISNLPQKYEEIARAINNNLSRSKTQWNHINKSKN